ncbi:ASCH domain-containing protein [Bradyrhizobium vignae]|uniref:ASCH domain-containing protein n=1 Tax=Bradyrhizobium vignae TaxID=1549949 RepID=UPI001ABFA457|nr:ASCH domain-containing protein [Bradyrhizobium vignae]
MKILSVREPWASLIIHGGRNVETGAVELKDVENRTWATSYRGPVLIHTSQRPDAIRPDEIERRFGVRLTCEQQLGGVIGMVDIVDCVRPHPSRWYAPDHFAFVLANPRPLPFVRWKGALSLRTAPAELLEVLGYARSGSVATISD